MYLFKCISISLNCQQLHSIGYKQQQLFSWNIDILNE